MVFSVSDAMALVCFFVRGAEEELKEGIIV